MIRIRRKSRNIRIMRPALGKINNFRKFSYKKPAADPRGLICFGDLRVIPAAIKKNRDFQRKSLKKLKKNAYNSASST